MKSSTWLFAAAFISFAAIASLVATVRAHDGDDKSLAVVAQSSKQKHKNVCWARYRDCMRLKQIPSFECQYIYSDCINHIT